MPAVKSVGEPCAGEPHARIEVAAGGNRTSRQCRTALAPPADPTSNWAAAAVHLAGCSANPTRTWVTQQARQFTWTLQEEASRFRFLIRDRDSKFTRSFDAVFAGEAIKVVKTPVRAPKANATAERFVRAARRECLDWLLIVNRRHLERVLCVFVDHYNVHRPHRSLDLTPPVAIGRDEWIVSCSPSADATASADSSTSTATRREPPLRTPHHLRQQMGQPPLKERVQGKANRTPPLSS